MGFGSSSCPRAATGSLRSTQTLSSSLQGSSRGCRATMSPQVVSTSRTAQVSCTDSSAISKLCLAMGSKPSSRTSRPARRLSLGRAMIQIGSMALGERTSSCRTAWTSSVCLSSRTSPWMLRNVQEESSNLPEELRWGLHALLQELEADRVPSIQEARRLLQVPCRDTGSGVNMLGNQHQMLSDSFDLDHFSNAKSLKAARRVITLFVRVLYVSVASVRGDN